MNPWQRWRELRARLEVAQARMDLERAVAKHSWARLGGLARARDRIVRELEELHEELHGRGRAVVDSASPSSSPSRSSCSSSSRSSAAELEIQTPEAQPKGPGAPETFAGCDPDP